MRKGLKFILILVLLAGGAFLCVTRWQAWFGMSPEYKWTGDTLNCVLPIPNGETDTVRTFLVLGDIHSHLTREDYDTLAARVPDCDVVLQTGDWLERGYTYYQQLFLREWTHSALYGTPVIACPGNHEYSKGLRMQLSPAWADVFAHPLNGPVGVPGASYYADLPQVRFIVMDTNPLNRLVYLTRTLTWLRQAMYTAEGRFIVVLMHHPVLPAGRGRFYPLIYTAFRHALGEADLVLAGHDHSYMRRAPFVVLNTAGSPKPQHTLFTPEAADSIPTYGVLTIDSVMEFRIFRMENGALLDSLYVQHD